VYNIYSEDLRLNSYNKRLYWCTCYKFKVACCVKLYSPRFVISSSLSNHFPFNVYFGINRTAPFLPHRWQWL